ncbi:MAG: helix-turn-helix domain-containing protein [Acetatifactor sp.]
MAIPFNLDHLNIELILENLTFCVTQISYGIFHGNFPMHQHSNSTYELHLVIGGRGTLILSKAAYSLKAGSLFMTGPGVAHEQLTDMVSPMEEYCITLDVKKSKQKKPSTLTKLFFDTFFWIGTDYNDHCLHLFRRLEQESSNQEIGYAHNVKCIITELIVELVRNYSGRMHMEENHSISLTNKRTMLIDQCFISQYATITENDLCELLALSPRQLQRFLKKHYNKTFLQMRREARLIKSEELLKTGHSLEEIANEVGYTDLRYLEQLLQNRISGQV